MRIDDAIFSVNKQLVAEGKTPVDKYKIMFSIPSFVDRGVSIESARVYYSQWNNNNYSRKPTIEDILYISESIGVSIDYLFGRTNNHLINK